ncbi:MAG: outer membrane beta-barrel protein [Bacteroidota bacterium]
MDRERNKDIDRVFRDHLQEASVAPPSGLWNTINTELENDRLRKKVVYWRFVAAAAVLLFLGVGLWMARYLDSVNPTPTQIAQRTDNLVPPGQVKALPVVPNPEVPCDQPNEATRAPAIFAAAPKNAPLRTARAILNNRPAHDQLPVVRKGTTRSDRFRNSDRLERAPSQHWRVETSPTDLLPHDYAQPLPSRFAARLVATTENPGTKVDPKLNQAKEIIGWREGDGEKKDKSRRRWAIGGAFSPDVAFATQTPIQPAAARTALPALPDDPATASRTVSDPIATFSTGLRAVLDVNERLSVRSGVLYTRRNTSKSILADNFGLQDAYANNFSVDFLEIPVSVQYNVIHGRALDYYVSTGVSGNLMVGYEQELQTASGRVAEKNVSDEGHLFTPAQANLLFSTGIQYRALNRVSINLEPGVRYGFLTTDYAFTREDPVSVSLMSGVNFHF